MKTKFKKTLTVNSPKGKIERAKYCEVEVIMKIDGVVVSQVQKIIWK